MGRFLESLLLRIHNPTVAATLARHLNLKDPRGTELIESRTD